MRTRIWLATWARQLVVAEGDEGLSISRGVRLQGGVMVDGIVDRTGAVKQPSWGAGGYLKRWQRMLRCIK